MRRTSSGVVGVVAAGFSESGPGSTGRSWMASSFALSRTGVPICMWPSVVLFDCAVWVSIAIVLFLICLLLLSSPSRIIIRYSYKLATQARA